MGKEVKPLIDYLLGDPNWLYEHNWDYYNEDVRLVRSVMESMSKGYWSEKIRSISCEEVLSIEMTVLRETIMFELTYLQESSQIGEVPLDLSLNGLLEFREESIKKLSPDHWYRVDPINYKPAWMIRNRVYPCPRKVKGQEGEGE